MVDVPWWNLSPCSSLMSPGFYDKFKWEWRKCICQWHVAAQYSVGLWSFLIRLSIVICFACVQKIASKQFECFLCCVLCSFQDFIKIPVIITSFVWGLHCWSMRTYVPNSENPFWFDSWPSQNFSSVQTCCEVEVEIFSVDLQVGNLQCSFTQEEPAYNEVIFSQHSEHFLHDFPIHIRNSKILYIQAARWVEELWLFKSQYVYSNSIYYIVSNWLEI